MDDRIEGLLHRIEALESRERRTRRGAAAVAVAALALGAMGFAAAQETPKVLRAGRLEIVDAEGVVRVAAGASEGAQGAYLMVSNEKRETRFAVATGAPLGCVVTLYGRGDGSESPGVVLHARPGKQMPVLAVVSPESAASAELGFESPDVPRLVLRDSADKPVVKAVGASAPSLSLAASEGGAKVELGFDAPDKAQVSIRDRSGKVVFKAVK